MGGPFWRTRPRAWSIPKGLLEDGEDPLAAARREFAEEIGVPAPEGDVVDLGEVRQASGKRVRVFALHADDLTVDRVRSNTVRLELPRGSGRYVEVPEVDDARWMSIAEARALLVAGQVAALDLLLAAEGAR
ncbi:DNA mismatch repair protein MutT [Curtobacterium sp. MCSS17_008]|nr:DNA mismatch repair protein MutT [Curtobacterium sp. MCSS17_008]